MTAQNELMHHKSLGTRALQGAGIALVLLIIFLLSVTGIDGEWVFLPMFTVSVGGACGGVFYYLMAPLRRQGGWKKVLANVICFFVYIAGLYFSLIAALNVTGHWS